MRQRETDSEQPRPEQSNITLITMRNYATEFLTRRGIAYRELGALGVISLYIPNFCHINMTPPSVDRGRLGEPNRPWVYHPARVYVVGFGEQYVYFHVEEMEGFLTWVLQRFQVPVQPQVPVVQPQ
jgi:hypothetical protein